MGDCGVGVEHETWGGDDELDNLEEDKVEVVNGYFVLFFL